MKRLPVNLATLPFESVLRARRALVAGTVVFTVLTLLHAAVAVALWRGDGTAGRAAISDGTSTQTELVQGWEREVDRLTLASQRASSRQLAEAVVLANELIAWRTLPWDPLFAALEAALPEDVRLELVEPVSQEDGVHVDLTAAATARSLLDSFLARLEEQDSLRRVYPTLVEIGADGRYRMRVSAIYQSPVQDTTAGR